MLEISLYAHIYYRLSVKLVFDYFRQINGTIFGDFYVFISFLLRFLRIKSNPKNAI